MMESTIAVAVFVKTPGLSPIKTRLARDRGEEIAQEFYRRSCSVVHDVLETVRPLIEPYWAVAEASPPHSMWQSWRTLAQGEGDLGPRLHRVYSQLLQRHPAVLLLGADSPHITPGLLREACLRVQRQRFVLGPALDGGFYLFGSGTALPESVWLQVPYSHPDTRQALERALEPWGPCAPMSVLRDVDTGEDLQALAELDVTTEYLDCQKDLFAWVRSEAPLERINRR